MTNTVLHSGHARVSRLLLVINICPAITESIAPYQHLFLLLFVLCVPQLKGDEFSLVQNPSHACIKSHCILGPLTFFAVGLPASW
jgi:hypothetical protein